MSVLTAESKTDYNELCRICLTKQSSSNDYVSVFSQSIAEMEFLRYSDMLESFAFIEVSPDDELPKSICKICARNIRTCYSFKKKCEQSFIFLIQKFRSFNKEKNKDRVSDKVNITDIIKTEKDSVLFVCECGESFFSEDSFNDHQAVHWDQLEEHPGIPQVRIKQEPIESLLFESNKPHNVHEQNIPMVRISQKLSDDLHESSNSRPSTSSLKSLLVDQQEVNNNSNRNQSTKKTSIDSIGDSGINVEVEELSSNVSGDHFNDFESDLVEIESDNLVQDQEGPVNCEICSKEYSNTKNLRRHMIEQHITAHKCEFCLKNYMEERNLESHIRTKHPTQYLDHQIRRELNGQVLKILLNQIEVPRCRHCEQSFFSTLALTRHENVCPDQFQECPKCDFKFKTEQELLDHDKQAHETIQEFSCSYCPASYSLAKSLKIHHSYKHPEQPFISAGNSTEPTEFICSICYRSYAQLKNLKCHHTLKHPNEIFRNPLEPNKEPTPTPAPVPAPIIIEQERLQFACSYCDKSYNFQKGLRYHLTTKHPNEAQNLSVQAEKEATPSPPTPEPELPRTLQLTDSYEVVSESDHTIRCLQCKKTMLKKNFKQHFVVHSSVGVKYKCDFCSWDFTGSEFLKTHMKQQHPDQLICKICGIQVRNKNLFEAHMKTHEEQEQEEESGKKLRSGVVVDREQEILASGTPYCKYCEREFTTISNYNRHMRSKHPQSPDPDPDAENPTTVDFEFITPDEVDYEEPRTLGRADKSQENTGRSTKIQDSLEKYGKILENLERARRSRESENGSGQIPDYSGKTHENQEKSRKTHENQEKSRKNRESLERSEKIQEKSEKPQKYQQIAPTPAPNIPDSAKNIFICEICDFSAKRRDYVKVHLKAAHPQEYMCPVCPQQPQYAAFCYFRIHLKEQHTNYKVKKNEGFACKKCFRVFAGRETLEMHEKFKHSWEAVKRRVCDVCSIVNPTDAHVHHQQHKKFEEFRNDLEGKVQDNTKFFGTNSEGLLECKICSKSFLKSSNLYMHLKTHDEVHKYNCSYCENSYIFEGSVKKHMKMDHPGMDVEEPPAKKGKLEEPLNKDERRRSDSAGRKSEDSRGAKMSESSGKLDSSNRRSETPGKSESSTKKTETARKRSETPGKRKEVPSKLAEPRSKKQKLEDPQDSTDGHEKLGNSYMKYISRTKNRHFKCKFCNSEISNLGKMCVHLVSKHQDKVRSIKCKDCAKSFINEDYLLRHRVRMHKGTHQGVEPSQIQEPTSAEAPKSPTCKICFKAFSCLQKIEQHLNYKHQNSPPFKCGMCLKPELNLASLKTHLSTHFAKKTNICKICSLSYHTITGLQAHKRRWHGEENPEKDLPLQQQIEKQQVSKSEAEAENEEMKMKLFRCKECDMIFNRVDYLHLHMKYRHKKDEKKSSKKSQETAEKVETPPKAPPTPEDLTCDLCLKEFRSVAILNQHKENHKLEMNKSPEFECEFCKLKFNTKKFLNNHKKFFCYWSKHVKQEKPDKDVVVAGSSKMGSQMNAGNDGSSLESQIQEHQEKKAGSSKNSPESPPKESQDSQLTENLKEAGKKLSKLTNGFQEMDELEKNVMNTEGLGESSRIINFDSLEKMVNEIVEKLDENEDENAGALKNSSGSEVFTGFDNKHVEEAAENFKEPGKKLEAPKVLEDLEKILTEGFGAKDQKLEDSDKLPDLDYKSREDSDFHDFPGSPGSFKTVDEVFNSSAEFGADDVDEEMMEETEDIVGQLDDHEAGEIEEIMKKNQENYQKMVEEEKTKNAGEAEILEEPKESKNYNENSAESEEKKDPEPIRKKEENKESSKNLFLPPEIPKKEQPDEIYFELAEEEDDDDDLDPIASSKDVSHSESEDVDGNVSPGPQNNAENSKIPEELEKSQEIPDDTEESSKIVEKIQEIEECPEKSEEVTDLPTIVEKPRVDQEISDESQEILKETQERQAASEETQEVSEENQEITESSPYIQKNQKSKEYSNEIPETPDTSREIPEKAEELQTTETKSLELPEMTEDLGIQENQELQESPGILETPQEFLKKFEETMEIQKAPESPDVPPKSPDIDDGQFEEIPENGIQSSDKSLLSESTKLLTGNSEKQNNDQEIESGIQKELIPDSSETLKLPQM